MSHTLTIMIDQKLRKSGVKMIKIIKIKVVKVLELNHQ